MREQVEHYDGDPLFAQHYAQLAMPDPRLHADGVRVMQRAVRKRPFAVAYYFLANLLWELRQFHEATDLYRFAAALDDREEQFAEGYFRAARVLEQTPEAMRFLQMRLQPHEREAGRALHGCILRAE
jgi:tetratricopeptide (TPR) repeat protein